MNSNSLTRCVGVLVLTVGLSAMCACAREVSPTPEPDQSDAEARPLADVRTSGEIQDEYEAIGTAIGENSFEPYPELVIGEGAEPAANAATALATGDSGPWLEVAVPNGSLGIDHADERHLMLESVHTASYEDLAPYCFLWPAGAPDGSTPAAREAVGTLLSPPSASPSLTDPWMGAIQTAIEFTLEGPQVVLAEEVSGEIVYELADLNAANAKDDGGDRLAVLTSLDYDDPLEPEMLEPLTEDSLDYFNDVTMYAGHTTDPEYARYAEAAIQLKDLISLSAATTGELSDDLAEILRATGLSLVNLIPPGESDPEVILGFDGEQAYRICVIFPSGVSYDSVLYFTDVAPGEASSYVYSYAIFQAETERECETFATFILSQGGAISLP